MYLFISPIYFIDLFSEMLVIFLSTNSKLKKVFHWLIDDNFQQRLNTIYDSLDITILDNTKYCYYNLRQVLQYITFRELKHQRRRRLRN